jgi:ribonuclease VapC
MIVVDASALLTVLLRETDSNAMNAVIASVEAPLISVPSVMECTLRFGRLGIGDRDYEIDELIHVMGAEIVGVDSLQLLCARKAFLRYGKGMGHPAQLNFGDCFSYALAKTRDLPLLYKGDDFIHTDIVSALT